MIAYPENTSAYPSDSKHRSLVKWNEFLYATFGNVGTTGYPEGTRPFPSDGEKRSKIKINAILNAT